MQISFCHDVARTLLDAFEETVIVGTATVAGRLLVGVMAQNFLAVCGPAPEG